ncbi:MAG: hypothetical protein RL274_590 [Pseudomonadota bacterium]|jgi:PAS domain-containing protein
MARFGQACLTGFTIPAAAITILDAGGYLLYANAHLNYLPRSLPPHETLVGRSYEELFLLEIDGGEIAPSALAGGVNAFISQRMTQLEEGAYAPLDVQLADRRVIEIKARRARNDRTVLLWSDVTAARAQLARLEEAVALSADAFAFFDSSDRLIMGNDLYAYLMGMPLDELLGKPFTEIAATVAYKGRIVLDKTPEAWLERRIKGHRAPVGATTLTTDTGECYLVRDRALQDGGRVIVITDITDKFRAETALAEQQNALAESRAEAEKKERLSRRPLRPPGPGYRQGVQCQGVQCQDHPAADHGP